MKYLQYINLFFVVTLFGFLVFFCYYFLQKDEQYIKELYEFHSSEKKFLYHILLLPNFFDFFNKEVPLNADKIHVMYIKKIFEYIEVAFMNNIHEVSVDLVNYDEMHYINYSILNYFFTEEFWDIVYRYSQELHAKINIICNDEILSCEQKELIDRYKNRINDTNVISSFKINFLINYDFISEVNQFLAILVQKYKLIDSKNIDKICCRENLSQILSTYFRPYEIIYACGDISITDHALFRINGAKFININYNLNELNKNIIDVIIKTSIDDLSKM